MAGLIARKGVMQVGQRYTIQYRLPDQAADRWACLVYAGIKDGQPLFTGEPVIKTVSLRWDWIKDYGPSNGGGCAWNRPVTW